MARWFHLAQLGQDTTGRIPAPLKSAAVKLTAAVDFDSPVELTAEEAAILVKFINRRIQDWQRLSSP